MQRRRRVLDRAVELDRTADELQAAFRSVRLAAIMFVTLPVALVGGVLAAGAPAPV